MICKSVARERCVGLEALFGECGAPFRQYEHGTSGIGEIAEAALREKTPQ